MQTGQLSERDYVNVQTSFPSVDMFSMQSVYSLNCMKCAYALNSQITMCSFDSEKWNLIKGLNFPTVAQQCSIFGKNVSLPAEFGIVSQYVFIQINMAYKNYRKPHFNI